MTNTIFDLVEPENSQKGYLDLASRSPDPKDDSWLTYMKDWGKTILKGGVEGATRLGRMMGPMDSERDRVGRGTNAELYEAQTSALENLLPQQEEDFLQRGARRALREAPSMMAMPGTSPIQAGVRSIAAGYLGEGAKELGAPEWVQTGAELSAFLGPDIFKKLVSTGNKKELIEAGRKFGMTDEQITPLLQSEFKQKWLTKLAPKRGATAEALKDTKEALSSSYSGIQKSEAATRSLPERSRKELISEMQDLLKEMPADVRKAIKKDVKDFLKNEATGESLINLYKDINYVSGANKKQLTLLKDPIKKALSAVSPELGKDFEMVNKLHSKYYEIAKKLRPNITTDIVRAAETLGLMGSTFGAVVTGNYLPLVAVLGEKTARKFAQQLLINPRLQQLSTKTIMAANMNKYAAAKLFASKMADEMRKSSPEMAEIFENISQEDIYNFFNHQEKGDLKEE